MHRNRFSAVDTLFFRDGSPFNANEFQSDTKTLFPPSPFTVVGAVRAALARSLGWNGRNNGGNNWATVCESHLGSGDDLGPLSFAGPLVSYNDTLLFPSPYSLMGRWPDPESGGNAEDLILLRPGQVRCCDLGEVRLPEMQSEPRVDSNDSGARKLLAPDCWVTAQGLNQILDGQRRIDASQIHHTSKLWQTECRVGITRDATTRTTLASALYSPKHIRLDDKVQLAIFVDGLNETMKRKLNTLQIHSLGGESRAAWIEVDKGKLEIDSLNGSDRSFCAIDGRIQYSVVLLTPVPIDQMPLPGRSYLDLPGTVVSACVPRPQYWGGWNSRDNSPQKLQPYLSPGSVLYMEAPADQASQVEQLHLNRIGDPMKSNWGFGLVAIGKWPAESVV